MATELLYMESIAACYDSEFSATVTAIAEDNVVLDRTLFYPLGGGQNWDVGRLKSDIGTTTVTEVRGRGEVNHFVGNDHGLEIGDEVYGTIDWERRYSHMRMHTAQHLVSGVVYDMFHGTRTVGNQIHADRSRIDFHPIKFDMDMLDLVFTSAQEIIESELPVTCSTMTRDEVNKIMPPERTNMDLLPISVKQLRVITIGDNFDLCPCAGTHVANLSEIGELELLGKKNKGSMVQRISYTLK
ncbi:MAG TPA: alanyl-tRNA editing protein [Candidatus Poseidoniales archaeon]|nr:MAG: alanyl-tRNA editing protein [Euryarchaeota archaeon]HIA39387.1 alanyl-tRNA editing protein [Candidatus Poseidoniales archaeon]PXY77333.1 MAG: alanyl-tRNA editing protein [Euryarchaeota archaeon]HIA89961.1 alanyl-tRNA editing protein [Candidatus Poseidoniales archaeon]HIB59821.1 alanyl-tRNA editing protein [Candidatus Poseidoniales archaeon]